MSLLVTIDTDPKFTPKAALPLPERLISGSPEFKTWAQDDSRGEMIQERCLGSDPGRDPFD